MVHEASISSDARKDLASLVSSNIFSSFYFAGGTGLALHLGHRESIDLDFFSGSEFDLDILITDIQKQGSFQLDKKEKGTVIGRYNNTLLSFFYYPYPLLEKTTSWEGIEIASILDIACMKLDAAASRGTKKDYIDLYFILRAGIYSLQDLLSAFEKKYQNIQYNLMHIKKGLVYFVDAEADPMPKMRVEADWDEIKKFLVHEVTKLSYDSNRRTTL